MHEDGIGFPAVTPIAGVCRKSSPGIIVNRRRTLPEHRNPILVGGGTEKMHPFISVWHRVLTLKDLLVKLVDVVPERGCIVEAVIRGLRYRGLFQLSSIWVQLKLTHFPLNSTLLVQGLFVGSQ